LVHRTPIEQDENPLVPVFPGVATFAAGRNALQPRSVRKLESQGMRERAPVLRSAEAECIFILFNHAVLTDVTKRKLASEKRRPNLPIIRGAFHL